MVLMPSMTLDMLLSQDWLVGHRWIMLMVQI
jgi:hypothetical protein